MNIFFNIRSVSFSTFLFLITSGAFFSFSNSLADTLVETGSITQGKLNTEQVFIGTIHFSQSSLLASKTQGMVLKINFDTTQKIQQGDILVELDHEILDSRIKAIQASIKELHLLKEKSSKDLKRYKKLLKQKNVSQQKYDEIYYDKIRIDQKLISSNAESEALLIERQQNIITAPFNGVITARHVEIGEWVDKGGEIATLVNPDKVISLFDIPASYALEIKPEQKLMIKTGNQSLKGIIEGVIIKGDNKSRTFPLKIKLLTDSTESNLAQSKTVLFEGMEAQISLPRITQSLKQADTLLVPRDAVIKRFGNDVIFVVDPKDNKAKMYSVTVHLYDRSLASISSNDKKHEETLHAGMQVIVKGNERVFPGQTLKFK